MNLPFRLALARMICTPLPPLIAQRVRIVLHPSGRTIEDDAICTVHAITGSSMPVPISDYHGYPFAVHGYYDWRNTVIARAILLPGDTVIEIGANIGTETVGLSDIVGADGTVIAFEPLPSNIESLERVRETVTHRNIRIFPFAVSDEEAQIRFEPPRAYMSGTGRLVRDSEQEGISYSLVDCHTLDMLSDDIGHAAALFIDTEGEEVRVLRGGRKYISTHLPYIIIEASDRNLQRSGFSLQDLHTELCTLGYMMYEITRLGLRPAMPGEPSGLQNWFCHPRGAESSVRRVSRIILASALLPCIPGIHPLKRLPKRRKLSPPR